MLLRFSDIVLEPQAEPETETGTGNGTESKLKSRGCVQARLTYANGNLHSRLLQLQAALSFSFALSELRVVKINFKLD